MQVGMGWGGWDTDCTGLLLKREIKNRRGGKRVSLFLSGSGMHHKTYIHTFMLGRFLSRKEKKRREERRTDRYLLMDRQPQAFSQIGANGTSLYRYPICA